MKAFVTYFSLEEADAQDLADHLKATFGEQGLEVFMATTWESIAPGEEWEAKIIGELRQADALLVLMSIDALTRPWINFEIGVAWATNSRILLFCHKGMTPSALPRPYGSLQAVDLNGLTHEEKVNRVAEAVAKALPIQISATREAAPVSEPATSDSFASTYRAWSLRPAAHVGETAMGRFLVGAVYPARPERAKAAGLQAGEALYVRLFLGATPEGRYLNVMVGGELASFFERVIRDTTFVECEVRLAAPFEEEGAIIPLFVIDSLEKVGQ